MFIEKQNIENDKINFSSHTKIKTTRTVINTEPLISKKNGSELQDLNFKAEKLLIIEMFLKILMNILIHKFKNNLLNDYANSIDNHTHFMEQAFTKPYPSMESKCIFMKKLNKKKSLTIKIS